ncbi:MAG TPA: metalloregulator ArsR/SmtB family transcription factor [Tabrizicola sp.]|nr:metalloregulator ArsR/SmtB family transcription factor [Tabrizicola sp.]
MSFDRIDVQIRNPGREDAGTLGFAGLPAAQAESLAALFKALGHEGRLQILWLLAGGEMAVSELEESLGQRQAAVSQQLARLRLEGLVLARREGKAIHYSLVDGRVRALLRLLPDLAARG